MKWQVWVVIAIVVIILARVIPSPGGFKGLISTKAS